MFNTSIVSTNIADTVSRLMAQIQVRRACPQTDAARNARTMPSPFVRTADAAGNPVIAPLGAIDRTSFESLIQESAALRAAGHTAITVDLSGVDTLELCGIYALHAIAALYTNLAMPDAFSDDAKNLQSMRRLAEANFAYGRSPAIRLVGLCPNIHAKITQVGLDQVYTLPQA